MLFRSKIRNAIVGDMNRAGFMSVSFSYTNIACVLGEVTGQDPSGGSTVEVTRNIGVTLCNKSD